MDRPKANPLQTAQLFVGLGSILMSQMMSHIVLTVSNGAITDTDQGQSLEINRVRLESVAVQRALATVNGGRARQLVHVQIPLGEWHGFDAISKVVKSCARYGFRVLAA